LYGIRLMTKRSWAQTYYEETIFHFPFIWMEELIKSLNWMTKIKVHGEKKIIVISRAG
jgi:hypothetical protein